MPNRLGLHNLCVLESDEKLAAAVTRALGAWGYCPLAAVAVSVQEGQVVLRGRVPTYYLKQMAQSAAMSAPGIKALRNELEVR